MEESYPMFIGRKEYLDDLESLWRKRTSSIVACRGRRRIGKSTLFREFARRTADVYMEFEGLAPDNEHEVTNQDQLNEFEFPDSDLYQLEGCFFLAGQGNRRQAENRHSAG